MRKIRVLSVGSTSFLAGAVLLACSGTATREGSGWQSSAAGAYTAANAHIMPPANRPSTAATPESGTLSYYQGKVIPNAKIVNVYWQSAGSYQPQLDAFVPAVFANSTYMDFLSEYDTPTQNIGRGGLAASFVDTGATVTNGVVDDSQIQAELAKLVSAGQVPAPDASTLYMFYFPQGVNVTLTMSGQTSESCSAFCGYHSTLVSGSQEMYYGVIPDAATCGSSCDNQGGNYLADVTSVTSHEIFEAVTDPEVGIAIANSQTNGGTYPTPPNGWVDASNGQEIGDLCAWQNASVAGYNVQLEWSDAQNKCVAGPANPPPQDGGTDADAGDGGTDASDGGAFVPPTCDGVISPGEYGGAQNQATSDTAQTWYMTWDATNLYVAIDDANTTEGSVLYVGSGSSGASAGQSYDGTDASTLPFSAQLVVYAKDGYSEARTASGGGWGAPDQGAVQVCSNGVGTREEVIPWSLLGGAPASFGWTGYLAANPVQNPSGYIYGQMPVDDPQGANAGSEAFTKYYSVVSSGPGLGAPFGNEQ